MEKVCGDNHRGLLKIKNEANGLWYKRFCVLEANVLSFYRDNQYSIIEYEIIISNETIVEEVHATSPRFLLQGEDFRVLLAAESKETLTKWITAINAIKDVTNIKSMNDFDIISVLGKGYTGKVMLVQEKGTGELFALKTLQKKRLVQLNRAHNVIAERNCLVRAKHPFIVQLCFDFQTPAKFYLGLEYASGGDLFYHLDKRGELPVSEVRLITAEIALALSYLHSLGIVYRDLKPENIMFDGEGHVKLTDFGMSKDIFELSSTTTTCGTTEYVSPEIILKNHYDYGVDWWALGIIIYEMITTKTPFENPNRSKMLEDIVRTNPAMPYNVPEDAAELISALLQKDSRKRPKFDQIREFKFFKDLDWERVYRKEYTPEFIPPQHHLNFDAEFTQDKPVDSPVTTMLNEWAGFSYSALTIDTFSLDSQIY